MKILCVDLSSVVRKFWEMDLSGNLSDGTTLSASVDYITRARDGFDRVVLALDVGQSFRKLHCAEYKAKRSDPGEVYRKCYFDVAERLRKDGAKILPSAKEKSAIAIRGQGADGVHGDFYPEADDVIASLAAWYKEEFQDERDCSLRIMSGDTDLWAIVHDGYAIEVLTINGSAGSKVIHEAEVRERFGGVGAWVTEVKALAGDKADGYDPFQHHDPTMKGGIGEGKAIALLKKYGDDGNGEYSAAEVVARANLEDGNEYQMPDGHERKCLRAARGGGLEVGYACARMLTDLPLDFSRILAEPKVEQVTQKPASAPSKTAEVKPASLVRYEPAKTDLLDPNALQPQTLEELFQVGAMVVNSRVHPHIDCPEKAMMVIAEARERRVPFGAALRAAYFVHNRLSWSASFLAGLVQQSEVCDIFEIVETTPARATVLYKRKGRPEGRFTFELDEAVKAGWVKKDGKWGTNPRVMLRWAALREAARAFFPDVVSGMYTPDELRNGHVTEGEFEQTEEDFAS